MAINLLNIKPHKVSRDLSGYITYLYAPGGAGKTSFGSQMPSPLLLAFERGYNALPGIMPQDIVSWSEVKQVLRELKKPEVKETYRTIICDTVDIAASLCEKYVCNQLDIENIGDGGWTKNGWAKVKKEWEETWRSVTMEGYAVLFISHSKDKTFTRKDGSTYNQIVPSCPTAYNEIIKNMSDLMAYIEVEAGERRLILRSPDESIDCKCRFKYIDATVPFGYQELVDALNRAIDKEALETEGKFVTDEKLVNKTLATAYDFDAEIATFKDLVGQIMAKNQSNAVKITAITDKYLGKGKKASDATPAQVELIHLINIELKEDILG